MFYVLKPKQYGMDYFGHSPAPLGLPNRPPKDAPSRPPKPSSYNADSNLVVGDPPLVPPRRRNSPALLNVQHASLAGPGGGRPPLRPSSRANGVAQETSLVGRPVSQPTPIARSSAVHLAGDDDDVTPTGSPAKDAVAPSSDQEAPTTKPRVTVRMFYIFFSHVLHCVLYFLCHKTLFFCLNSTISVLGWLFNFTISTNKLLH